VSRIGATLSGIERSLLNRLAEANAAATLAGLRMATGNKINHPSDDPAAFVRLSGLQSRLGQVRATMDNVTAAASMVTQTQSAIDQIRTQLSTIRTELLGDEDGELTGAQRDEAQANIDTAVAAINELAAGEIDGRRILDGSANFTISGRNADQVAEVRVYSTAGSTLSISGEVTQAAARAELVYTGDADNEVTDAATFTLAGNSGSVEIEVTGGQTLSAVALELNAQSHLTGVTAAVDEGAHTLTFTSVEYGSDAQVDIDVSDGTFSVAGAGAGTDVQATIGSQSYTGDGNLLSVVGSAAGSPTHYSVEFAAGFTGVFDTISVSGDALTFALWPDLGSTSTLAVAGMNAWNLGGPSGRLDQLESGGALGGLDTNTSQAIRVVDEALADVTRIEGAVDGFYNAAISSSSALLADLEEDLQDAIDEVNLVDDTEEIQRLAYYQDLAANAVAGLTILQLQRSGIVALIQQIAGLS